VSASRHGRAVVSSAGLTHLFDALVDGEDAATAGLPAKPDPALFLEAARRLELPPAEVAVVEDALPGVQAARAGGFGLVLALDRSGGQAGALRAAGAHDVIGDLADADVSGRVPVGRL
ncbi:MAG: HAD-IA family hydrolase, partial [Nonomuraea sp.]|nr:HAD-IA family hydrolase [Nonomuraea sp.]